MKRFITKDSTMNMLGMKTTHSSRGEIIQKPNHVAHVVTDIQGMSLEIYMVGDVTYMKDPVTGTFKASNTEEQVSISESSNYFKATLADAVEKFTTTNKGAEIEYLVEFNAE